MNMTAPPDGVWMIPERGDLRGVLIGQSCAADERRAAAEFHAAVGGQDRELVIFFCSSEYDLDVLAQEMRELFSGVQVVGCTTSGEIGPMGCNRHSLAGASFPSGSFVAVSALIGNLTHFGASLGDACVQEMLRELEGRAPGFATEQSFAFLMVDGLAMREEQLTHALQGALGKIPLLGGSAGDDLKFERTHVYRDGAFHFDSAILLLCHTALPFTLFKTQHFVPSDVRMVVTGAEPGKRLVHEINGLPAAREYARLAGVDVHDLDPMRFAAYPVVVRIGGMDFVRSIQKANPDGSLTFYCAIDEGLVLRLARGENLVNDLERVFDSVRKEIGPPQAVLGCDCILRKIEIGKEELDHSVEALYRRNRMVGFNSYGEQFLGIHVNQTLTGLAIGFPGGNTHA